MTTIGVIFKKEDKLIAGTAEQVTKELKKKGYKIDLKKARFVITLGGDGTILRAARLLAGAGTPILGVHMGGVGFLTEVELHKLNEALEGIRNKKYWLDERVMLEAAVAGRRVLALNDLVISKSGIARVIKLELPGIAEYTADGLIFSTATGSTAYNLSAGGPLLMPDAAGYVISAICPHSINTRPLLMGKPVTVVLNRGKEVNLTADGQDVLPLHEGQRIRIQQAEYRTRFIRLKKYAFFERVKQTFGFGPKS